MLLAVSDKNLVAHGAKNEGNPAQEYIDDGMQPLKRGRPTHYAVAGGVACHDILQFYMSLHCISCVAISQHHRHILAAEEGFTLAICQGSYLAKLGTLEDSKKNQCML